MDIAIHWIIDLYPVGSAFVFPNAYPALDSDLSGEWRYPTFEQVGPGVLKSHVTSATPWKKSHKVSYDEFKLFIII